jgi:hypothetical protein
MSLLRLVEKRQGVRRSARVLEIEIGKPEIGWKEAYHHHPHLDHDEIVHGPRSSIAENEVIHQNRHEAAGRTLGKRVKSRHLSDFLSTPFLVISIRLSSSAASGTVGYQCRRR